MNLQIGMISVKQHRQQSEIIWTNKEALESAERMLKGWDSAKEALKMYQDMDTKGEDSI